MPELRIIPVERLLNLLQLALLVFWERHDASREKSCAEHMFGDVTSHTRSFSEGSETKVPGVNSEGLPHGDSPRTPASSASRSPRPAARSRSAATAAESPAPVSGRQRGGVMTSSAAAGNRARWQPPPWPRLILSSRNPAACPGRGCSQDRPDFRRAFPKIGRPRNCRSVTLFDFRWFVLGAHCGSQVVDLRYGWGLTPWRLRRRRHLLRSPGGLPGQRSSQGLFRALAQGGLARFRRGRQADPAEGQRPDSDRRQGQTQFVSH